MHAGKQKLMVGAEGTHQTLENRHLTTWKKLTKEGLFVSPRHRHILPQMRIIINKREDFLRHILVLKTEQKPSQFFRKYPRLLCGKHHIQHICNHFYGNPCPIGVEGNRT